MQTWSKVGAPVAVHAPVRPSCPEQRSLCCVPYLQRVHAWAPKRARPSPAHCRRNTRAHRCCRCRPATGSPVAGRLSEIPSTNRVAPRLVIRAPAHALVAKPVHMSSGECAMLMLTDHQHSTHLSAGQILKWLKDEHTSIAAADAEKCSAITACDGACALTVAALG